MRFLERLLGAMPSQDAKSVAIRMADCIFHNSVIASEALSRSLPNEVLDGSDKEELRPWTVVFEFEALFMNLVDRTAFDVLNHDRRARFMNGLATTLVNQTISEIFPNQDAELRAFPGPGGRSMHVHYREFSYSLFNDRAAEYSRCKLVHSPEGDPLSGSVYCAFSKNVAKVFDRESDPHIRRASLLIAQNGMDQSEFRQTLSKMRW